MGPQSACQDNIHSHANRGLIFSNYLQCMARSIDDGRELVGPQSACRDEIYSPANRGLIFSSNLQSMARIADDG